VWHIKCTQNQPTCTFLNKKGLQEVWTRATFVLRKDYLSKLKAVSCWDRKKIKEVIDEALGLN
jgi:hypothetical protein